MLNTEIITIVIIEQLVLCNCFSEFSTNEWNTIFFVSLIATIIFKYNILVNLLFRIKMLAALIIFGIYITSSSLISRWGDYHRAVIGSG
jgi:hypothetical protein